MVTVWWAASHFSTVVCVYLRIIKELCFLSLSPYCLVSGWFTSNCSCHLKVNRWEFIFLLQPPLFNWISMIGTHDTCVSCVRVYLCMFLHVTIIHEARLKPQTTVSCLSYFDLQVRSSNQSSSGSIQTTLKFRGHLIELWTSQVYEKSPSKSQSAGYNDSHSARNRAHIFIDLVKFWGIDQVWLFVNVVVGQTKQLKYKYFFFFWKGGAGGKILTIVLHVNCSQNDTMCTSH